MKKESNVLGILAIVFSVLGGLIGLVLGIVGLITYKEPSNRKLAKIALIIGAVWVVGAIIGVVAAGLSSGAAQPLFVF